MYLNGEILRLLTTADRDSTLSSASALLFPLIDKYNFSFIYGISWRTDLEGIRNFEKFLKEGAGHKWTKGTNNMPSGKVVIKLNKD